MDTLNGKILKQGFTFDDVLLVPAYSKVVPAKVKTHTQLTPRIKLNIPICAAAMDTVCEKEMALTLAKLGGIGFIHKNMSIQEQADMIKAIKNEMVAKEEVEAAVDNNGSYLVGAAVGVSDQMLERVDALVNAKVDIISVDSAHGHSLGVIDAVRKIRQKYPNLDIVGGNIVTAQAAIDLVYAGANVVKVGVGPGSICTTRVVAGVGVPQLTAVNDVFQVAKTYDIGVIADGGIKLSGDIVKALAAGSDCVMLGGLLAGCDEAPGEIIEINSKQYKSYVGMGSLSAMKRGSSDRYFQGGKKELSKLVPEGIEAMVPYKGSVIDVVYQMMGGLRSGMGYCGCESVSDLKDKAHFVSISNAGLKESHPHDVENIQEAPNYHGR